MKPANSFYTKALKLYKEVGGSESGLIRTQWAYAAYLEEHEQVDQAGQLQDWSSQGAAKSGLRLN